MTTLSIVVLTVLMMLLYCSLSFLIVEILQIKEIIPSKKHLIVYNGHLEKFSIKIKTFYFLYPFFRHSYITGREFDTINKAEEELERYEKVCEDIKNKKKKKNKADSWKEI